MTDAALHTSLVDWRGETYGVGDHILYAGSQGSSSAFLTQAEVVEILPPDPTSSNWRRQKSCSLRVRRIMGSGGGAEPSSRLYSENNNVYLTSLATVTVIRKNPNPAQETS